MSFIGSMVSLSSRVSDISDGAIVLRGLCQADPSTQRGRRLLLTLAITIPATPVVLLVAITCLRLGLSLAAVHTAYGYLGNARALGALLESVEVVQMEGAGTARLFCHAVQTPVTLNISDMESTYRLTDDAIQNSAMNFRLKEAVTERLTDIRLHVSGNSSDASALADGVNEYNHLIKYLLDGHFELDFGSNADTSNHIYTLISAFRALENLRCSCFLGCQLLTGDLHYAIRATLAVAQDYLQMALTHEPALNKLSICHNNSCSEVFTTLDNLLDTGNLSQWSSVCHQYLAMSSLKWSAEDQSAMDALTSDLTSQWGSVAGYLTSLLLSVPIMLFIVHNARLTTNSIADIVAVFANKVNELKREKRKTELLLKEMLPRSVAKQLLRGARVLAEQYDAVTVYFGDIAEFNELTATLTDPMQLVTLLNSVYSMMDSRMECYEVYKVETIGNVYMVASGLPLRNGGRHVVEIANMAVDVLAAVEEFVVPQLAGRSLQLRVGIHTGPCVAGVVGNKMPRYCLFGDTVNTASRMQSTGIPNRIHVSQPMHAALEKTGKFVTSLRGLIHVKGKGSMETYWLDGRLSRDRLGTHVRMEVLSEGLLQD